LQDWKEEEGKKIAAWSRRTEKVCGEEKWTGGRALVASVPEGDVLERSCMWGFGSRGACKRKNHFKLKNRDRGCSMNARWNWEGRVQFRPGCASVKTAQSRGGFNKRAWTL